MKKLKKLFHRHEWVVVFEAAPLPYAQDRQTGNLYCRREQLEFCTRCGNHRMLFTDIYGHHKKILEKV